MGPNDIPTGATIRADLFGKDRFEVQRPQALGNGSPSIAEISHGAADEHPQLCGQLNSPIEPLPLSQGFGFLRYVTD
jgi:hypothetical protein